eukprot:COSAG01_NODE_2853_length_6967_cov_940.485149_4_plen_198_part_00
MTVWLCVGSGWSATTSWRCGCTPAPPSCASTSRCESSRGRTRLQPRREQLPSCGHPALVYDIVRVWVEIMGSQKCGRIVGKSQSVLIMINPIIYTRTRILYASLVLCARGTLRIAASPLSQVLYLRCDQEAACGCRPDVHRPSKQDVLPGDEEYCADHRVSHSRWHRAFLHIHVCGLGCGSQLRKIAAPLDIRVLLR